VYKRQIDDNDDDDDDDDNENDEASDFMCPSFSLSFFFSLSLFVMCKFVRYCCVYEYLM